MSTRTIFSHLRKHWHIDANIMFFSNQSWWWWYSLFEPVKDTHGSVSDSARPKWQLSLGELSVKALFNSPRKLLRKTLNLCTTHKVPAAKMDMRSLFWPRGESEWRVALKKTGKSRSKGLLWGNGNGFDFFPPKHNGLRWRNVLVQGNTDIYV